TALSLPRLEQLAEDLLDFSGPGDLQEGATNAGDWANGVGPTGPRPTAQTALCFEPAAPRTLPLFAAEPDLCLLIQQRRLREVDP
ncbi:MAG: hypothetical protein ACKPB4_22345, partial [Sphaerospermopsis kisseleviana]